jgi:anthranilate synthase/indole-3-glycerol phosphate synthase/phosphoribosylanthranilate isomerase
LTHLRFDYHLNSNPQNRPAILRKDFLIDEYQVYEAIKYGADSILLIVAALTEQELSHLYKLAKQLGMEPLVEVNTTDEMKIALKLGAKIIGINNRNLHDFSVDLQTTGRLLSDIELPSDVILAALSGINERKDVEYFEQVGAQAVLQDMMI